MSLVLGVLAVAALPAAVVVAQETRRFELLDAAGAIPVAAFAGVAALTLARSARRRIERTLGRVGGERTARVGGLLGMLALCLAAAATISLAVYAVLLRIGES